ncbi:27661_t:CDS:10 [Gigaspora margarita]|uniref:Elongator complex protein 2 n=1 Tax=Gigaspora margarita TaxID=4874 RepID=A0ABN7UQC0_GIGMA|nr:27661_t:CDS:10 [Gigaspora margarita]
MVSKVSNEFTSIGCNRVPQVAAWGKDGMVAFGAYNYVALYYPEDPECRGIISTLVGHNDRVNCVDFIYRGEELNQRNIAIISGSADRTARVWKLTKDKKWVNSAILESHGGSVNTIGVIRAKSIIVDKDLIVTGSADGAIKVWERSIDDDVHDSIKCLQIINLEKKYPMALALSYLPESKIPMLACGSTNKKILLYIQNDGVFIPSLTLQGHENWIRSLSFATYTALPLSNGTITSSTSDSTIQEQYKLKDGDLLLASASQDKYVRLWRVSYNGEVSGSFDNEEVTNGKSKEKKSLKELLENLPDDTMDTLYVQLHTKAHIIDVDMSSIKKRYSVMFEALLMGHDDWVYSVCWQPPTSIMDKEGNARYHQPMSILTSSSDKSMMVWKPDQETGVWVNLVRVGEIGGYALGFFGGLFGPKGNYILAHGHTGAFHLWKNLSSDHDWQPQISISGCFNSVQDITWDPTFKYLVSVSLDQTTRLFAPWIRQFNIDQTEDVQGSEKQNSIVTTWHEIGRPQIHGYDIQCIAFVNQWRFVSGADEKAIFDAPKTFVQSISKLLGEEVSGELESRPLGANLPPLGLSNKAIFNYDVEKLSTPSEDDELLIRRQTFTETLTTPSSLKILEKPPFEEQLLQNTLWPEIDKLYGHGYELISVGASHDGKYVACACKATTPEDAIIRLYNTTTWKELSNGSLKSHSLTVTKIRFSHSDKLILSVSRDRTWSLFEKCEGNEATPYKFISKNKAHARIIWDCSWSHDDLLFATASRDKTIKIWNRETTSQSQDQNQWHCITTLKFNDAVTAIDFAPRFIAIGLENGQILCYQSNQMLIDKWNLLIDIDRDKCHAASVNRLTFRSTNALSTNSDRVNRLQLASCGSDWSVRILNLDF